MSASTNGYFANLRDQLKARQAEHTVVGYYWDRAKQSYMTPAGLPMPPDVVKASSEAVIKQTTFRISHTAEEMRLRHIPIADWFGQTSAAVKDNIAAQVALARGGWDNMRAQDWDHAESLAKTQLKYLHDFARDVANKRYAVPKQDELSTGVVSRAQMYANYGRAAYENTRVMGAKADLQHDQAKRVLAVCDHCFPAGTLISVWGHDMPIECLSVGDIVLTRFGFRKILHVYKSQFKGDLLTVRDGNRSVQCTPNHPFLTSRGWIAADELVAGEKMVTLENRGQIGLCNISIPNSDDGETSCRQIRIARRIAFALRYLSLIQRFIARVAMPPFPVRFKNQVADFGIDDEIGFEQNMRFVGNAKPIKNSKHPTLKARWFILLHFGRAFHKFRNDIRAAFGRCRHSFSCAWKMRRVMFAHISSGGTMNYFARSFGGHFDFQMGDNSPDFKNCESQLLGYYFAPLVGIISPHKVDLFGRPMNFDVTPASRAICRTIILSAVAFWANWATARRIARFAIKCAPCSPMPTSRACFPSAAFELWLPLRSAHNEQVYHAVYNLEIEDVHEYIANGFVVHNCDGCTDAAESGWMDIDDVLPIGDAECGSNCHCIIVTRKAEMKEEEAE